MREGHSPGSKLVVIWGKTPSLGQREVGERKAQMKTVTNDGRRDEEQKPVSL